MVDDRRLNLPLQLSLSLPELESHLAGQGLAIVSAQDLRLFQSLDPAALLYSQLTPELKALVAPYLPISKAQLGQDLFALAVRGSTSPAYFVEFGATDGATLSNTWLLENVLGWQGILAEPAMTWHSRLHANRRCRIDHRCVYSTTGERVQFLETQSTGGGTPELSSLKAFAGSGDWASPIRLAHSIEYSVDTVSLNDLLDFHGAPAEIQFLSLDTEGSEYEILQAFDFSRRVIRSICVEHNHQPSRQQIFDLLSARGYTRVFAEISAFDDWYLLDASMSP